MLDIASPASCEQGDGLKSYYVTKIEELQLVVAEKTQNLRRLQAQRNELNAKGMYTKTYHQIDDYYSKLNPYIHAELN